MSVRYGDSLIKRGLAAVVMLVCSMVASAQDGVSMADGKVRLTAEYTGELQTDFGMEHENEQEHSSSVNCMNLLRLGVEVQLSRKITASVSTMSMGRTSKHRVVDDLQVFSNIEAGNLLLGIEKAGLEWNIDGKNHIFAGIRNIGYDYFTSDVTSLFTNSSCGIVPTVGCSYPIANYPVSSVGLHYTLDCILNADSTRFFGFKASLYNGVASNGLFGRDNVFRVCPGSDGVFGVAQAEYRFGKTDCFLGGVFHTGIPEEGLKRGFRTMIWAYGEHQLTDRMSVIAAYSHAFHDDATCFNFAGVGGKYKVGQTEIGLFTDYADFRGKDEWAAELTCRVPFLQRCFVQPTVHLVGYDGRVNLIGLFRLGVAL